MRRITLVTVCAVAVTSAFTVRAPAPPAESLDDLAWIAGHWGGEAFGGQVEEAWFAPAGRSMSGSFRLIQNDLAVMYELLLLEQDDDGEIYYRFKHISRGWEPWEEVRLEYRLTELEDRKATFRPTSDEPPQNAPAWFTYESPSGNRLVVTIHGGESPIVLAMRRR
ncbi:MAG: DUF6265 family protein [Gemmatimonadota bacterium]|nr:DUF6265 family protein [Gemmatimonadota bacterium]